MLRPSMVPMYRCPIPFCWMAQMALLEMPSCEEMVLKRVACALQENKVKASKADIACAFIVFSVSVTKIVSFCDG